MTFTRMMWRSAVAKMLGLGFGLLAFFLAPMFFPAMTLPLRLGFVGLFLTIGGIVGVVGFVQKVPLVNWHLPPYLRGGMMGLWMGVLAALLGWGTLAPLFAGFWGLPAAVTSPLWIAVDCAIAGALIDVIATRTVGKVDWPETGLSEV